ncbi:polysaccharide biosynthesis protein [Lucifera butyrica]|uniref:Polysaccharide biosynthesis protein n=1 Tax=Lucifera butyrica TaxID=1351585 RepID=A0A498R313_9FIRM|nr:polysaccharide biosynthesis protein [Lucifera butyrica]VBB07026.1 polysaccharide biosynthesis protein [Lucifera butyrica]
MSNLAKDEFSRNKGNFLKGTLVLTIAGFVVKIIGSLNWIFLSRVLSGEGIGLYQMAFPIYLLALSVSSAGIPVAISIITAEKLALRDVRGAKRVFTISLVILFTSGLLFSVLTYLGAGWLIDHRIIRDVRAYYSIIALAPAIFFVTLLSSFRGYLQGWQEMTPTAVSQIVEQLVRVITMLVFANLLLPRGLEYAAAGASLGAAPGAVGGLLVLLYYYWKLRPKMQLPPGDADLSLPAEGAVDIIRRLVKLALPVSMASIMLPIVSNLDMLIVPTRLEAAGFTTEHATEQFGYLTGMAVPLVNLATLLTASLATSLVPSISEAKALGNRQAIYRRTESALNIATWVGLPGGVLIYLLAAPIAQLIYHAPDAGGPVRVLAVGIFLLGVHQVTTGVLQGLGHTTIPVVNMGFSAVIKVILNWTLTAIPLLGIKGAAGATVADFGIAAALNMYFIYREVGFAINSKYILKTGVAAAVMGLAVMGVYNGLIYKTGDNTWATLSSIAAGGAVYLLIQVAIGGLAEEDIRRVPYLGGTIANSLQKFGVLGRRGR